MLNERLAHIQKNTSLSAEKGWPEDRTDMLMDLREIEPMDGTGLRGWMEWARMEDELNEQLPNPDEDPGWWFDRREEIARGQVLLSGITWPGRDMPRHGSRDSSARRGDFGRGRGPGTQAGSPFPSGSSYPEGSRPPGSGRY